MPTNIPLDTFRLNLNGNKITVVDANSFPSHLSNLRILQLNNNPIGDFTPGTFHNVRKIHTLQLQFTELTHLTAGVFDELTRLKWLWLNDCKITTIDSGTFLNMYSIWEIYLYNNPALTTLPYGIFQDSPKLKHLYLQGTALEPVNCCHFVGLNKWLDIKWPDMAYLDTMKCPCDSGLNYIDCHTSDFPSLKGFEGSCPLTFTFNSGPSLRLNLFTVSIASLVAIVSFVL